MKKTFVYFVFLSILSSCVHQQATDTGVANPQLTKNDQIVYFQYYDGMKNSIWKLSLTDSVCEQITPYVSDYSFYYPRLTNDDDRIVFVGRKAEEKLSTIFIYNVNNSSIQDIFSDEYVYDAFISKNRNEIIYAKPDTFANYSPIARKAAHGYDIFSFDMNKQRIEKLTEFNSYNIDGISDYKNDSLLYSDDDEKGIYAIARNNPSIPRVIVKNSDSNNLYHWYGSPVYNERYDIFFFINSYEIYLMTSNKRFKRVYLSDKMISSFCVFHNSPRILFTIEGESCFYTIKFDGTDLRKINVQLPKPKVTLETR